MPFLSSVLYIVLCLVFDTDFDFDFDALQRARINHAPTLYAAVPGNCRVLFNLELVFYSVLSPQHSVLLVSQPLE